MSPKQLTCRDMNTASEKAMNLASASRDLQEYILTLVMGLAHEGMERGLDVESVLINVYVRGFAHGQLSPQGEMSMVKCTCGDNDELDEQIADLLRADNPEIDDLVNRILGGSSGSEESEE